MFSIESLFSRVSPQPAAPGQPLSEGQQRYLKSSRWLSRSMDARWRVGPLRFGAETFLDFVPFAGVIVPVIVSIYQLWVGMQLHLPGGKLRRMVVYSLCDALLGTIPGLGWLLDTFFKVHLRNQRIIDNHLTGSTP